MKANTGYLFSPSTYEDNSFDHSVAEKDNTTLWIDSSCGKSDEHVTICIRITLFSFWISNWRFFFIFHSVVQRSKWAASSTWLPYCFILRLVRKWKLSCSYKISTVWKKNPLLIQYFKCFVLQVLFLAGMSASIWRRFVVPTKSGVKKDNLLANSASFFPTHLTKWTSIILKFCYLHPLSDFKRRLKLIAQQIVVHWRVNIRLEGSYPRMVPHRPVADRIGPTF